MNPKNKVSLFYFFCEGGFKLKMRHYLFLTIEKMEIGIGGIQL